jgi:hypothetical protein
MFCMNEKRGVLFLNEKYIFRVLGETCGSKKNEVGSLECDLDLN